MTPFSTFTHDSCAAFISPGVNIGLWAGGLPQDCSGRNDRRGGGGGADCLGGKYWSSVVIVKMSGKEQRKGINQSALLVGPCRARQMLRALLEIYQNKLGWLS
jgi:hypothetical protein